MALTNPPGWLQNAGATHTAAQLRTYLAGLVTGQGFNSDTLRTRGGVHPSLGLQLAVTQTGSPSMAVLVDTGVANIPGTLSTTQGNYYVANTAQETLSIAAAHATLPRIDIVVINVRDSQYSGVSNDSQLQVITGTPASSPVAPNAPDNAITLAHVAVAAAVTSITNANITDTRFYLAGVGGVIQTKSTEVFTGLLHAGQPAYETDTGRLKITTDQGTTFKTVFTGVNVQVFGVNGTWTKPAGAQSVFVMIKGAGGGGGGVGAAAAGQHTKGGGGGEGGYAERWFDASALGATEAVVVGGGGIAGASGGGNGGGGGTTTFNAMTAIGGVGGSFAVSSAVAFGVVGGSGGTTSGGTLNFSGASGGAGWGDGNLGISGHGGGSGGGVARVSSSSGVSLAGATASNYGGGGSGALATSTGAAAAGGAGSNGFVVVYTFGA